MAVEPANNLHKERVMMIRQWQSLAALGLAAVFAVGCEQTPAQKQADQVRKDANNTADAVRDQSNKTGDALRNEASDIEKSGEKKADAIEDAGEKKADVIEENGPVKTVPPTTTPPTVP